MILVCGKVGRDDMDSYSPARSSLGIADIAPHPPPPTPISSDTTTVVVISCVCTLPCMS